MDRVVLGAIPAEKRTALSAEVGTGEWNRRSMMNRRLGKKDAEVSGGGWL